jgi:hypothetical protein
MDIDLLILKSLQDDEEYSRKIIPHLKKNLFQNPEDQIIFDVINSFIIKYNSLPSLDAVEIMIGKGTHDGKVDQFLKNRIDALKEIKKHHNHEFMKDETESWIRDMLFVNLLKEGIGLTDKSKVAGRSKYMDMCRDALSFSLDESIGHDFWEDAEFRYDYYTKAEHKIPFLLDKFNEVTLGGFSRKTLNTFIGSTNVGKTSVFCSLTTDYLIQGYNVLYLSMEISECDVAQRIDQNILNINNIDIKNISKEKYLKRIKLAKSRISGKLKIKQLPTGVPTILDFYRIISDLELKNNFIPDVIIVDYMGIMSSCTIKIRGNSNEYFSAIANELRRLAIEKDVIVITGNQFNREGMKKGKDSAESELTDIADAIGITTIGDEIYALFVTPTLAMQEKVLIKRLKSRIINVHKIPHFVTGFNIDHQRLYNCDSVNDNFEIPKEIEKSIPTFNLEELFSDCA